MRSEPRERSEPTKRPPSMGAATELTKRFLRIHGDAWEIECELRQLDGPEFGIESR